MKENQTISVAYGDGIGPEIMEAVLYILKEAKVLINIETVELGEKLYLKGNTAGISKESWEAVRRNKVLLKAPITTPQGKGHKSLNVTFRKALGLYANVRPVISYYPVVDSNCKKMDMVIIRENEEDLYAGVEYRATPNYTLAYKIITRKGSEKIIRYAFEYARLNNRKKVTCLVKDNIMKITDGMFHNIFDNVAKEYPEIIADSMIVDIGSARIASRPEDFDVIVTLNLYGDIISDIAAEVSGSIGLAGSSNIGNNFAMFEAVHGSAPDIAGKQIANPSGLLNAAIQMIEYLGHGEIAAKIKNAWLKTLEDGIHTADIYKQGKSKEKVGTQQFAKAVVANIGNKPINLPAVTFKSKPPMKKSELHKIDDVDQKLIGVDVYVQANGRTTNQIADIIKDLHKDFKLHLISQRGLKIWPESDVENYEPELLRCRFLGFQDTGMNQKMVVELLEALTKAAINFGVTNCLYTYDGQIGFSLAQGE